MKYLLFSAFMLLSSIIFAQKTPKLSAFINQCVTKSINGKLFIDTKDNFVHFFSIAISFDTEGKIDTLYYSSKLNPETKRIFALDNSLLKRIKTYNFKFKEYASKTVLFPYYCYKITDNSIDYKNGFLNSIEGLVPEAVYNKPLIIMKPVVDASLPTQIN